MKKSLIFFVLTISLLAVIVSAATIKKEMNTNVIVAQYNQPVEASLTITDANPGKYNIYTFADVTLLPTDYFELTDGENRIPLKISPMDSLTYRGFYTFIYYLKDSRDNIQEDRMMVKVVDLEDMLEISSDSNYPEGEMKFYIRNKENARLKFINAKFSSIFFELEDTFSLEPMEKKEFTVAVDSDKIKKIPAGSYLLETTFKTDRGNVSVNGKIFFGEKKGIETKQEDSGIFVRTTRITKINFGNTVETIRIDVPKNILFSMFTFFSEKPEGKKLDGLMVNYYWIKRVNPDDSLEIVSRTNFLIPLLIVVVVVGTIVTFRKYGRAKLEIIKSVSHVRTKGGEFALRIRLHIRVHRPLENVSIIDRIPALVNVHETFGIIRPSLINLKERRVQWNLGNLQSGEERMFSYLIYSKVGVVGKFSLPKATGVFEENGNLSETFSNSVFFLSEQVKKVD
jgi:hypothetical protein